MTLLTLWLFRITIVHFRVDACFTFKASHGAQPFKWKWVAYCYVNQTHLPKKRWAPRLASKPRQRATPKWPIAQAVGPASHPGISRWQKKNEGRKLWNCKTKRLKAQSEVSAKQPLTNGVLGQFLERAREYGLANFKDGISDKDPVKDWAF